MIKSTLLLLSLNLISLISYAQVFSEDQTNSALHFGSVLVLQRMQESTNSHTRGLLSQSAIWNKATDLWDINKANKTNSDFSIIRFLNMGSLGFYTRNTSGTGGSYSLTNSELSDYLRMIILNNGNVGIGTSDPQSKLAVDGKIRATEVQVLAEVNSVPDYVFESDYKLRTLMETKKYISENKHLPEIPSATEIGENGIDLGDMDMRLLKKIEELTLYQIQLLEKLEQQNEQLQEQQKRIENLENDK